MQILSSSRQQFLTQGEVISVTLTPFGLSSIQALLKSLAKWRDYGFFCATGATKMMRGNELTKAFMIVYT